MHYMNFTLKDHALLLIKMNFGQNKTAPAIHASVPCFLGAHGLLASDICDWIDHAQLPGSFACVKSRPSGTHRLHRECCVFIF